MIGVVSLLMERVEEAAKIRAAPAVRTRDEKGTNPHQLRDVASEFVLSRQSNKGKGG